MRKVLEITVEGCRLVGTCHLPDDVAFDSTRSPKKNSGIGMLFFNSGFLPRSPVGDLTNRICDHFAGLGIPSFRFDMAGLGDSDGDLPEDVETFFSWVLAGGHGASGAALSRELARRFELSGIALSGLCGGAVTSVYAAAADSTGCISGIALLDPSFQLTNPAKKPNQNQPAAVQLSAKIKSKRRELYQKWRLKILETQSGKTARRHYLKVKSSVLRGVTSLRAMRGEPLPTDANRPLISAFTSLGARQLPILVLMAGSEVQHTEKFDYLKHIAKAHREKFAYRYLSGTTHSFVEGDGEKVVTQQLQEWVESLAGSQDTTRLALHENA